MFAIVYKSDGTPVYRQEGNSAPAIVVWTSESAANDFIQKRGAAGELTPVSVTEQSMEAMAKALGCGVDQLVIEQYPS